MKYEESRLISFIIDFIYCLNAFKKSLNYVYSRHNDVKRAIIGVVA